MSNTNITREIELLAAEIGENVYIDVAKWHLYLREAHLHTLIAQRIYPLLETNSLSESSVAAILKDIPVELGGGKMEIPLDNLLPNQCQTTLMNVLEEYQRKM